jgi:hypothetical protein
MSRYLEFKLGSDSFYLTILLIYLGSMLVFSSLFYLSTEDYEAVTAVLNIRQGLTVGKSTGWPYGPLAPYLFYACAVFFDESILVFRLLTAGLLLGSIFPLYFTLRYLSTPFVAFAVTLFSFSLTTFPDPRLEYYVEAAFLSFAIYFAVRFIQQIKSRDLYLCAVFLLIAFGSRGYPNVAILLGLIPMGLIAVIAVFKERTSSIDESHGVFLSLMTKKGTAILLYGLCAGVLMAFLKNAVFYPFLFHYGSIVGPASFRLIKEYRTALGIFLITIPILIYFALRWIETGSATIPSGCPQAQKSPLKIETVRFQKILLPFVACGLTGVILLWSAGYTVDDFISFLFPLDALRDHVRQIRSGRSYVIPLFFSYGAGIWYLHLTDRISLMNAKVGGFLVLLLPATFVRFFPGYNMLYLGGFALAVFIVIVVPQITGFFGKHGATIRLQRALAIFLILYSVGSNLFLVVRVQLTDLWRGHLIKINHGVMAGIYVEKDVADYFREIQGRLAGSVTGQTQMAFLSHRYLKFVPLQYGWNDVVAGHNLMIHLGRLWSYDDVVDSESVKTWNKFEPNASVYDWRQAAVDRLSKANTSVIVMSLYDMSAVRKDLLPSADPFREYLRRNFVRSHVIEPAMKIHRRSRFAEGAIIFKRKNPNR